MSKLFTFEISDLFIGDCLLFGAWDLVLGYTSQIHHKHVQTHPPTYSVYPRQHHKGRLEKAFSEYGDRFPFLRYSVPRTPIIAALSVQKTGDGR